MNGLMKGILYYYEDKLERKRKEKSPATAHWSADVDFREIKEKEKGKNIKLPVSRSCIISSEEQK